jgi:DinB family protein
MFIPNSPSPPRGIAVSVCVGLLKKSGSPVSNLKSYHTAKLALLFRALPPLSLLLEAFHGALFSSNSPPGFALVYNSQRNVFGASYQPVRHFPWPHQIQRNFCGYHRTSILGGSTMRRTFAPLAVVVCAVLALFFAGYAPAQQLSPGDKDKALQLFESTKKDVLDATRGLSEAQWNFKTAPDRRSVAECMEHIAAAEDFLRQSLWVASGLHRPLRRDPCQNRGLSQDHSRPS